MTGMAQPRPEDIEPTEWECESCGEWVSTDEIRDCEYCTMTLCERCYSRHDCYQSEA